jgi:hypothetical protein
MKKSFHLVRHRPSAVQRARRLTPLLLSNPELACGGRLSVSAILRLCAVIGLAKLEVEYPGEEANHGVPSE